MKSKIAVALVSIVDSITNIPASSLTATEMVTLWTSMAIYFLLSKWAGRFCRP